MKFSDFLNENDAQNNSIDSFLKSIIDDIKNKNETIIVLNPLYTTKYKNKNDVLKDNKIDGYFVYNKNDQGDNNFYLGSFNYDSRKNITDISLEVSDPYSSINDIDFFIKTKLKAFKL